MVLVALAITIGGDDAAAQQPKISVAEEIKLVEGEPQPFSITISPDQSFPIGGRIVILTLEAPLSFSSGSADAEFGWKLSPSELGGLTVSPRRGKQGQWVVVVGLVDETSKLLASASSLVTIEPSNKALEPSPESKPLASSSSSPPSETDTRELRRVEEERRQAEARQKVEEERREAEAREKVNEERRQAEARQKVEEERREAEARDKAKEERRQAEARQKVEEERREAEARDKAKEERRQAEARQAADEQRQKAASVLSVADRLVSRGEEQLAKGNVALAREFFRRAADVGLAKAALLMGDTFNATELARYGVIGIKPDPREASRWYEKARELGALTEASQRLERLKTR